MGRKTKHSYEERINAVLDYLSSSSSQAEIATRYGVERTSLRTWVNSYRNIGPDSLRPKTHNNTYSADLKASAISDYLSGKGSLEDIRTKYGLKSTKQLRQWIWKYNSHETIKPSKTGGLLMTKGRKTTFDERIEIVKYCIEHANDYNATAEKFAVSYQQVYSWVIKYEDGGVEALEDRRGKKKIESQMSEIEKLKAANKLLEAENRRQRMEIDFLKKLEELERRRS